MGYVLAVRANHTVTTGWGRTVTAAGAAGLIPARAWQRMRTGSGTKGTRHYDWAMLEVASDDTPGRHSDGHSVLLARRHRCTGRLSYYRCWTPGPVRAAALGTPPKPSPATLLNGEPSSAKLAAPPAIGITKPAASALRRRAASLLLATSCASTRSMRSARAVSQKSGNRPVFMRRA